VLKNENQALKGELATWYQWWYGLHDADADRLASRATMIMDELTARDGFAAAACRPFSHSHQCYRWLRGELPDEAPTYRRLVRARNGAAHAGGGFTRQPLAHVEKQQYVNKSFDDSDKDGSTAAPSVAEVPGLKRVRSFAEAAAAEEVADEQAAQAAAEEERKEQEDEAAAKKATVEEVACAAAVERMKEAAASVAAVEEAARRAAAAQCAGEERAAQAAAEDEHQKLEVDARLAAAGEQMSSEGEEGELHEDVGDGDAEYAMSSEGEEVELQEDVAYGEEAPPGEASGTDLSDDGDEGEMLMAAYAANYQRLYDQFRAEGRDDGQAARYASWHCDEIAEEAAQALRDG